jgi:hypothetical protein
MHASEKRYWDLHYGERNFDPGGQYIRYTQIDDQRERALIFG